MSPAEVTAAHAAWRAACRRWERSTPGPERRAADAEEVSTFTTYQQARREYLSAATE